MKTKTKRSLFVSAVLLLVSVSMLIGSTFAWFTDNVTSKNNLIQSGNLDVELYYAATSEDVEAENWTEVTASTDIFGYDLWEPGYVKTAYFKVVNNGSLALKYQLSADVYSETPGVNKAGETFLLSDSIRTAVVEAGTTRDQILAMTGESLKGSFAIDANAQALYPKAQADANKPSEKIVGLAIWMPTTVGNEANHNGESVPAIEFGINLLATQYTYEMDSFGHDYDTGSTYPMVAFGSMTVDPAATEYLIPLMKADGGKVGSALIQDDSVAEDAAALSINVVETKDDATVSINADQDIRTFDITVTGLKENNDVPIKVELNVGTGLTGVEFYHRNVKLEKASYNATKGVITFATTSFSPFSVVYDAQAKDEVLDETKPAATVEDVSATYANTELDWTGWGGLNPNDPEQQLEAVFLFKDSHDEDWVAESAYKDWYCDFYVKMDRYVPENAVVLGGNYGGFGWVGFNNPVVVEAETWVPLLASFLGDPEADSGWSYNDIAVFVREFLCGVAHCDSDLDGATFTVQLRLTNPADSSDVIVAAEQAYTFGSMVEKVTTAAELKAALANGEKTIYIGSNITLTEGLNASNVTFVGASEDAGISFDGHNITGSGTITYRDLDLSTISLPEEGNGERYGWYGGIDYMGHAVANYEGCSITGVFTTYSGTVNATDCIFHYYVQDGEEFYNMFLYGEGTVNATNCTFMYGDRAIKVYSESTKNHELNLVGCKFVAEEDYRLNKPLINFDSTYFASAKVTITNNQVDEALRGVALHNGENDAKITVEVK